MANNEENKTMKVGFTVLMLWIMFAVVMVSTSVAAGFAFGAAYGFLALAAWAVLAAIVLARALRKIVSEERDDG